MRTEPLLQAPAKSHMPNRAVPVAPNSSPNCVSCADRQGSHRNRQQHEAERHPQTSEHARPQTRESVCVLQADSPCCFSKARKEKVKPRHLGTAGCPTAQGGRARHRPGRVHKASRQTARDAVCPHDDVMRITVRGATRPGTQARQTGRAFLDR